MLPSDPHQSDSGYVPEAMDSRQSLEGRLPRGTKIDLMSPQTIWKLDERFLRIIIHLAFDWATLPRYQMFPQSAVAYFQTRWARFRLFL